MKPYSPALHEAFLEAGRVASHYEDGLIESSALLVGFAQDPSSEAGSVLFRLGFTPEVAIDQYHDHWTSQRAIKPALSGHPSDLLKYHSRKASRRATHRLKKEITSGELLFRLLKFRTGGNCRILKAAGVSRRRARKAIKHEMKTRRALRLGYEGAVSSGSRPYGVKGVNKFDLSIFPIRRFAPLRKKFALRLEIKRTKKLLPLTDFSETREAAASLN